MCTVYSNSDELLDAVYNNAKYIQEKKNQKERLEKYLNNLESNTEKCLSNKYSDKTFMCDKCNHSEICKFKDEYRNICMEVSKYKKLNKDLITIESPICNYYEFKEKGCVSSDDC